MMIGRFVLVFAAVLVAAVPAAAQQPARERQQGHAHGGRGHNDLDDAGAMLRMLTVYQMRHRAQHGRYAASLQELGLDSSRIVTVRITANGAGFAAVSASSTEECAIFSGAIASPRPYVARANEVVCRPRT